MPRGMPIERSVGSFASSHAAISGNGTPRQNARGSSAAAVSAAVDASGASNVAA